MTAYCNHTRLVVIARKPAHGRLALRLLDAPLVPPTPLPPGAIFDWRPGWLYGHPLPKLVVHPALQPADVRGADLALLVERRQKGGPLYWTIAGRSDFRLYDLITRLRREHRGALWQVPHRARQRVRMAHLVEVDDRGTPVTLLSS